MILFESRDPARPGRSFRFAGLEEVLRADDVGEVLPLLERVEAAVASGLHAAGFVSYEASPGMDSDFIAYDREDQSLPLAWFGLFRERKSVEPMPVEHVQVPHIKWSPSVSREEYSRAIAEIHEFIAQGETYQVNHTFKLRAESGLDPLILYRAMCAAQSAANCAYMDIGTHTIMSASPELFFQWAQGRIITRPMKGTMPRGKFLAEDIGQAEQLAASEKDRAENVMIVDLMRNDLGRLARPGSVEVTRLFEVERYETVFQMTSQVEAEPRTDVGLADVFMALFPCGSITGAPKIRTMQIIRKMECGPRGVYTGALGFVSPGPEAVFSVPIRTVVARRDVGKLEYGVGGGITHYSTPEAEYEECRAKALILARDSSEFSLLETLRHDPESGWFLLERHLERMENSARYFGYGFRPEEARCQLEQLSSRLVGPARVRLLVDHAGNIELESFSLDPDGMKHVRAVINTTNPVDRTDPFLFNKTTRREIYESRSAGYEPGIQVVMINDQGMVTESPIANVVVEVDGCKYTPPVDDGLLPGTFRAELLDSGEIRERSMTPEDLFKADQVYLINSVRGWMRAELE